MTIGPAATWNEGAILLQPGKRALVASGPYFIVRQGQYAVSIDFHNRPIVEQGTDKALLILSVMSQGRLRAERVFDADDLAAAGRAILFEVHDNESAEGRLPLDLQLWSSGAVAAVIRSISISRIGEPTLASVWLKQTSMDWTPGLQVGAAAVSTGGAIRAQRGAVGTVVYGPYRHVLPGRYRLRLDISGEVPERSAAEIVAVLEVAFRYSYIAHQSISVADLAAGQVELEIEVGEELAGTLGFVVETKVRCLQPADLVISRLVCERLSGEMTARHGSAVLDLRDWLPLLYTGDVGTRRNNRAVNRAGAPGFILYGPYWTLPAGEYEATFVIELQKASLQGDPYEVVCWLDVAHDNEPLELGVLHRRDLASGRNNIPLGFVVTPAQADDPAFSIELRVRDNAVMPIAITAVNVKRVGEPPAFLKESNSRIKSLPERILGLAKSSLRRRWTRNSQ
jgi:hypothetical protein